MDNIVVPCFFLTHSVYKDKQFLMEIGIEFHVAGGL